MLSFPVKPMLLEVAEKPFDSEKHIFEWKVDGIRCVMFYSHGKVRLQSKTGRDCTAAFPEMLNPPVNAEEVILDGEITVLTGGKPDFEGVMGRYLAGSKKAETLATTKPVSYIVWDILWHDGKTLINLPLIERKEILDRILENNPHITKMDWVETKGLALWEAVKTQGLEGVVAKRKDSRYEFRRSSAWLKIKNYQEAVVNVFGYSKKDGSILVGTSNRVQGHAIGIRSGEREALRSLLHEYGTEKGASIFLPPGIRGKVKYTTLTPKENMRDCHWVGFEV